MIKGIDNANGEYLLYATPQPKNGGMSNNSILYKSSDGLNYELSTFTDIPNGLQSIEYIKNNYYLLSQWGVAATRQLHSGPELTSTTNVFENDEFFSASNTYVVSYAYGNDKFVVSAERDKNHWESEDNKTKYFYVSGDGKNFEKHETDIKMNEMAFGNNVFVGISSFDNSGIYKSTDGINWTKAHEFSNFASFYGVIYRDNTFYVWYNDTIYTSEDGTNWKELYKNSIDGSIINFDYKNGVYAYTCLYGEEDKKTYETKYSFKVFVSNDAKDWTESTFYIPIFIIYSILYEHIKKVNRN